jgi:hypothetical protein
MQRFMKIVTTQNMRGGRGGGARADMTQQRDITYYFLYYGTFINNEKYLS